MRGHRKDIQGLRALAVCLVIANHVFGWPSGGFVGVDVFFVLSGFLITGLLLRERELTGRISLRAFYRRRFRRILPLAVVVLTVGSLASWLIFSGTRAVSVITDALWALLFGANWNMAAAGTNYLLNAGPEWPFQHFWSLSVEEQFYLLWPVLLIVAFAMASGRRIALGVIILIGVVSFGWSLWQTGNTPAVAYFSTFSRVWELAAGAFLAILTPTLLRIPDRSRPWLAWIGLIIVVGSAFLITPQTSFPGPWALVPIVGTCFIVTAGMSGKQRFLQPLTNAVSTYIGDISYSLYLWHFPVLILAAAALPWVGTAVLAVFVIVVSCALSVVSFHWIENPIRKSSWLEPKKNRDLRWTAVGAGAVAVALAAIIVIPTVGPGVASTPTKTTTVTVVNRPAAIAHALEATQWPTHLAPALDDVNAGTAAEFRKSSNCLDPASPAGSKECVYGDKSSKRVALVVGDSVSTSWMPGIVASIGKNYEVRGLAFGNCPFADVSVDVAGFASEGKACDIAHRSLYSSIASIHPDLLIISDIEIGIVRLSSGAVDHAAIAEWTRGLKLAVAHSGVLPASVVILSPPPIAPSPLECATRLSKPNDCIGTMTGGWFEKSQAEIAAASSMGATYVDTSKWFCSPSNKCPMFIDGMVVRTDGIHMTSVYSQSLAPLLAAAIPHV